MQLSKQAVPSVWAAPVKHRCFHCHEDCPDEQFRLDTKFFCCNGCQMVYEILNAHQLCAFYKLDEKAGRPLKNQRNAQAYAYLDDPEVREKLLEFDNGTLAQAVFYLPQMHCVSCIWLLEQLGKLDAGISHARANFYKKTVAVQFDPAQTSLRKIAALLASIGYAPEINLGDVSGTKPAGIPKRLAQQIAVAGFAFGNIMLFSFPEYVGMDPATFRWFADVFGYLSLLLAVPVLLYSAGDYFASAWQGLKNRRLNIDIPLCLALASLFGRSVWEILTQSGAGYLDSFAGLTFLLLIGKWFQQRSWNRLSFERDYKSYFPVAAALKTGDSEAHVPVNRLVPGDIIVVRSQEIIPADGILLKGEALVDYSFVTGEADPAPVRNGERIFAGGKQMGTAIELSLTRRVSQSRLTQLWNNEAFASGKTNAGGVSGLADQAGRFFSWLILAVGGGAFVWWWLVRGDFPIAINAFTAVMIVACPCTVALSIPFTLGNIVRILGRQRFYLKNNRVVESLAAFDAAVFDKTGTITHATQQAIEFHGGGLDNRTKSGIKSLSNHSSHPLSRRICAAMAEIPLVPVDNFGEQVGLGISGTVAGQHIRIGSATFVGTETDRAGSVFVSVEGKVLGYFEVKSRFRAGLAATLAFLRKGGAPVFLLSGDQDREGSALSPFFPNPDTLFFNQGPQDKLDFIKKLQQRGQRVLMIGDGLNDAGALRQSDTGIVVSENANNFTPACDAILHSEAFERLPQFIRLARAGVGIVRKSYAVALIYNVIGLSYAVTGALSPLVAAVLMPLSSVSIVLFGVGMGNFAARRL
ncbi:MAG: heavy metal translocating P-type ATPase metal-binding domain-containing protein [Saprospiraceae bacterium]